MVMPEHRTHTNRPGVVGPIRKCIHGDEHPTDKLSKEHVLPLGLSGGVILTKASCAACRKTTSAFERICLRQTFGLVRAHRNMPTRRPDERPTHGKLFVHDGGKEKVREVPLSEHPNVLALPEFSAIPAYITGNLTPPFIAMRVYGDVDEIQRRAALHAEATIFVGGKFDMDAFVRLLAKIGHGMMWASYKTENIRPLLLPIILDGQTANAWHLIGAGFRPIPKFSPDMGAGANFVRCGTVEIPNYGVYIITTIQLFAEWGAPSYSVICGEADREPPNQPVSR
jgi:hypothetical protein